MNYMYEPNIVGRESLDYSQPGLIWTVKSHWTNGFNGYDWIGPGLGNALAIAHYILSFPYVQHVLIEKEREK